MKLANCTTEDFIGTFGQEAYDMTQNHTGLIFLAETGMFPQIEKYGQVGGCVVPINPHTLEILGPGAKEIALILYTENLEEAAAAVPEELWNRFMTSSVVHELTHVKQIEDGRMAVKEFGKVIWEGKELNISLEGYVLYPWEAEAYMAQFTYLLGSEEQANVAYGLLRNSLEIA